MSTKQSVNWVPGQRVNVPDLKALDSSIIYDFATLLKCFQDNTPYILRGFTIPFVSSKTDLQMVVADSIVWAPDQLDGSFLKIDAAQANESLIAANSKVVGSFADGATNFVSIKFTRAADSSTADIVTQWDEDSKTEFAITAPRGLVLNYQIVISQSDFSTNAPVAIIAINPSGQVTSLKNAKNGLFRLGTGGASPNIDNQIALSPSQENPLTATSGSDPDPFAGGDWEIKNFKQWMDTVMTLFKKIYGSPYWYSSSPTLSNLNLLNLYNDAAGSLITSQGKFQQGGPGALTWSSDLLIRSVISPRTYVVPANNVSLADKQVAYISLERNVDFQAANSFTFDSITNTVVGTIAVSGIVAGDWIRAASHPESAWRKVKLVSGNTITLYGPLDAYPDNHPNYPTDATSVKALKSTGSYTMQVDDPQDVVASADTFWIAKRDDNEFVTLTIATVERSASISTITTTAPHSLKPGQMVAITGVLADSFFNINAEILSVGASTFTYINNGPDVSVVADTGSVSFLAIIYLRSIGELNEGESIAVDNQVPENILAYIGAAIDSQSMPIYGGVSSGSLDLPNYNSTAAENLTARLSKVTAMLGDNQQSYNIEIDPGSVSWVSNQVTIASASLSIPGTTVGAALVSINNITNQALSDNECLYVDISRTNGSALSLSSPTLLSALTPSQQRLVVVRRIGANILVRG